MCVYIYDCKQLFWPISCCITLADLRTSFRSFIPKNICLQKYEPFCPYLTHQCPTTAPCVLDRTYQIHEAAGSVFRASESEWVVSVPLLIELGSKRALSSGFNQELNHGALEGKKSLQLKSERRNATLFKGNACFSIQSWHKNRLHLFWRESIFIHNEPLQLTYMYADVFLKSTFDLKLRPF